jgi:putative FmdB family regulatory protein
MCERSSRLPLYEYKCVKCGHRFEKIEGIAASETKACPKCGAKAKRMITAPAIQFKGSGWYVTDYASKKSESDTSEKSGDGSASKPQEKAPDSKPSESKSTDTKSAESKTPDSRSSSEKGSSKKKK